MWMVLLASLAVADEEVMDPCGGGVLDVVPVMGASNVPVDAVVRARVDFACGEEVRLVHVVDGEEVQEIDVATTNTGWSIFSDLTLEADTSYSLVLRSDSGAETFWEFDTGSSMAAAPQPPTVSLDFIEAYEQARDDVRVNYIFSANIADTTGSSSVRFRNSQTSQESSAQDGRARGVLVSSAATPDDLECAQVVTVSASLAESAPVEVCGDPNDVEYIPLRSCTTAPISASWSLLLLPLLLLRRGRD